MTSYSQLPTFYKYYYVSIAFILSESYDRVARTRELRRQSSHGADEIISKGNCDG